MYELNLIEMMVFVLLMPVNMIILTVLSRIFKVYDSAWKVAIPLAIAGVSLEVSRILLFESESLRYLLSGINFFLYYIIAFILIGKVYCMNLKPAVIMWMLFSVIEALLYATVLGIILITIYSLNTHI